MRPEPEAAPARDAATPATEAVRLLRRERARFLIVEEDGRPQAILTERELEEAGDRPLGEISHDAPLVVVDELHEPRDLVELASTLGHTGAGSALIVRDDDVVGVIESTSVAEALELDEIAPGRVKGLPGDPTVPARRYVCRRCAPPTYRSPRGGFDAPLCPRDFSHGVMDPATP